MTQITEVFENGTCVQLKSGGPKMIVSGILESNNRGRSLYMMKGHNVGDILCIWFEGNEKKTGLF